MNGYEVVEFDGVRYAEILWAHARVPVSKFFSPAQSSFQFELRRSLACTQPLSAP